LQLSEACYACAVAPLLYAAITSVTQPEGRTLATKQAGFTNISNLTGGILAWAEKIDPSMPKY
jgi:hypothetical protein